MAVTTVQNYIPRWKETLGVANAEAAEQTAKNVSSGTEEYVPRWKQTLGYAEAPAEPTKTKRGTLDRVLGMLGYSGVIEGLYNTVDDDPDSNFVSGLREGLHYMNPFTDDVSGRHTGNDFLKQSGLWKDSDPDKLTAGDVARGVTGLALDIVADPLTYINPIGAAAKIVKGTGKEVSSLGKVNQAVAKALSKDGNAAIKGFNSIDEARTVLKNVMLKGDLADDAEKALKRILLNNDDVVKDFMSSFNKTLAHVNEGGRDLEIGFRNLPFSSKVKVGDKRLSELNKTIVSSDKLREIGDRTVAPYYNALARRLRYSRLGQALSTGANKEKRFIDELVSGAELQNNKGLAELVNSRYEERWKNAFSQDALRKAYGVSDDFFKNMDEETRTRWTYDQDSGAFEKARNYRNLSEEDLKYMQDSYEAAEAGVEAAVKEDYKTYTAYHSAKAQVEKGIKTAKGSSADNSRFFRMLGEYLDKNTVVSKNGKRMVNLDGEVLSAEKLGKYLGSASNKIRKAIKGHHIKDRDELYYAISRFAAGDNTALYKNVTRISDANLPMANYETFPVIDSPVLLKKIKTINFTDEERRIIGKLTGGSNPDTVRTFESIFGKEANTARYAGTHLPYTDFAREGKGAKEGAYKAWQSVDTETAIRDFADAQRTRATLEDMQKAYEEVLEHWTLSGESLEDILNASEKYAELAKLMRREEIAVDALDPKYVRGTGESYVYHMPERFASEKEKMEYFKEHKLNPEVAEAKGYNASTSGLSKKYDKMRVGKTLEEINERSIEETGKKLFNTDPTDIIRVRLMGHSDIMYKAGYNNFIKQNFGISLEEYRKLSAEMKEGISVGATYADINTILERYIEHTVKDAELTKARKAGLLPDFEAINSKHSVTLKRLKKELIKRADDPARFENYFSSNNPLVALNDAQIEYLYDKVVKRGLMSDAKFESLFRGFWDDAFEIINKPTREQRAYDRNAFFKLYDKFLNFWKLQNTIVRPGFHVQNFVSNLFQSFLSKAEGATSPQRLAQARKIMSDPDSLEKIVLGGKEYTMQQLFKSATDTGVVDNLFHLNEFADRAPGILGEELSRIDPTSGNFVLNRIGTQVGSTIEATNRMALFLAELNEGKTIYEAADEVDKYLFNYADLTRTEEETIKRAIPFYTFMKKNFVMELAEMLEQPQTFANVNRALNTVEQLNPDYMPKDEREEWRQNYVQFPTDYDGKRYAISNNLPYEAIETVLEPQKLASSATPALKFPYEVIAGKYLYNDLPVDSASDYLKQQFYYPRFFSNLKQYRSGSSKDMYILGQLLGFPIGQIRGADYYKQYEEKE